MFVDVNFEWSPPCTRSTTWFEYTRSSSIIIWITSIRIFEEYSNSWTSVFCRSLFASNRREKLNMTLHFIGERQLARSSFMITRFAIIVHWHSLFTSLCSELCRVVVSNLICELSSWGKSVVNWSSSTMKQQTQSKAGGVKAAKAAFPLSFVSDMNPHRCLSVPLRDSSYHVHNNYVLCRTVCVGVVKMRVSCSHVILVANGIRICCSRRVHFWMVRKSSFSMARIAKASEDV